LEDLSIHGKIILILKLLLIWDGKTCTKFMWLMIWAEGGGGLL
jgi:hypothetical protein